MWRSQRADSCRLAVEGKRTCEHPAVDAVCWRWEGARAQHQHMSADQTLCMHDQRSTLSALHSSSLPPRLRTPRYSSSCSRGGGAYLGVPHRVQHGGHPHKVVGPALRAQQVGLPRRAAAAQNTTRAGWHVGGGDSGKASRQRQRLPTALPQHRPPCSGIASTEAPLLVSRGGTQDRLGTCQHPVHRVPQRLGGLQPPATLAACEWGVHGAAGRQVGSHRVLPPNQPHRARNGEPCQVPGAAVAWCQEGRAGLALTDGLRLRPPSQRVPPLQPRIILAVAAATAPAAPAAAAAAVRGTLLVTARQGQAEARDVSQVHNACTQVGIGARAAAVEPMPQGASMPGRPKHGARGARRPKEWAPGGL